MALWGRESQRTPPTSYLPVGNILPLSTFGPSFWSLPGTVETVKMKSTYILLQRVYNPPEVKDKSRDITI